jgi:outer membrane protein assembly factor BamB
MSLKDHIKWLIRGWLPSRNPEKVYAIKKSGVGFSLASVLIASILLLNIQFFFPPHGNSSESQQGMKELWSLGLFVNYSWSSRYYPGSLTISVPDINGDGINDVVTVVGDNNTYCLSGKDGSILWKQNLGRVVTDVWAVPSQGEDGFNIVASTDCSIDHYGETYLLNGKDGSIIWEFSKGPAFQIVPDINDDGIPEIVTLNEGKLHTWSCGLDSIGWRWEYDNISLLSGASGEELWTSNIINGSFDYILGSVCADSMSNINSSIIAVWPIDDPITPYLVSFDLRSGKKIWSNQVSGPNSFVIAHVKGKADVIIGTLNGSYLINGEDGEIIWAQSPITASSQGVDVMQDIDGDGTKDILVGSVGYIPNADAPSKIRLLSGANGTTLWEHTIDPSFTGLTTIQDLNNDGVLDVVVAQGYTEDYIYILNGVNGEELVKYEILETHSTGGFKKLVVIPDVNGDGLQDIVVITSSPIDDKGDTYFQIFLLAPDPSEFMEQGSG